MATLTAASRRLSELGRALLVIRMTSPHPAHLRRFSTYKRCCAALLQLVMAQYRRHRVRAMPLPRLLQRTGVRFAQQGCEPAAEASRKCGRPGKSIIDRVTSRLRITLRDAAADSQTASSGSKARSTGVDVSRGAVGALRSPPYALSSPLAPRRHCAAHGGCGRPGTRRTRTPASRG